MKEFIVREEDTLKNFTDNVYPQGSFYLERLLKKKDVKVNGVKVAQNVRLSAGDRVIYYTTPAQESKKFFSSVFEDENVLVVDKESGVNSEALFNMLAAEKECYFIHRLDRNTEGLMIFAKTKAAEAELLSAFKERKAEKIYHAICTGTFKKDREVLTAYLKKRAADSTVEISENPANGVKIITEYRVLKREGGLNYMEITLHTGKTHQIRAHMAYIGCPVLGDAKYGDKTQNKRYNLTRQRLISKRLILRTDGALSYLNGRTFVSKFNLSVGE